MAQVDMAHEDDVLQTVAEVADYLKVNQQTVRNWIDADSLAAVRIGRRVRVRASELERFIAAGATKPVVPEDDDSPELPAMADSPTILRARRRFARALSRTVQVNALQESDELVEALEDLAKTSRSLSRLLRSRSQQEQDRPASVPRRVTSG